MSQLPALIWSVSDRLRGNFKTTEYSKVLLPFTVLRRLDCLLANTRAEVSEAADKFADQPPKVLDTLLKRAAKYPFYNTSSLRLEHIVADPDAAEQSLHAYVSGFSVNVRTIIERFDFGHTVRRLADTALLHHIVTDFLRVDLGPTLTAPAMGVIFEELIRRLAETSDEASGDHFTPRDVGQLMVALLTEPDRESLAPSGLIRSAYDPTCGTGGLLVEAADQLNEINPHTRTYLYGQEINSESWAIAGGNLLMRGHTPERIAFRNVLLSDAFPNKEFDYILASPPFGIDWRRAEDTIRDEHDRMAHSGRFGAGLPRISDGSLLFLQHMLAKMKPVEESGRGGSRVAILFNGAPLSRGTAGSGESEIRRWIVENDWLEGIVALPDQLFPHTAIPTYLCVLSNRKPPGRRERVILIKAQDQWEKMRRTLGNKRKYLGPGQLAEIIRLYQEALSHTAEQSSSGHINVVHTDKLLYRQITVERPLRLRFELTEAALDRLATLSRVRRTDDPKSLLLALRTQIGMKWKTGAAAIAALRRAAESTGQHFPSGAAFEKAVRTAIGVRDERGELQQRSNRPEPDSELRETYSLPLREDLDRYFETNVLPHNPDAWIDHSRTRVGCTIPVSLFYREELDGPFEPLRNFARLKSDRIILKEPAPGAEASDPPKLLASPNLHSANTAVELPDAELNGSALTPCSGGDLVGRTGNWRLLPPNFGEAVTSLFVLRPVRGNGRALGEWLNSRRETGLFRHAQDLLETPVPIDLVTDPNVDDLLEEVQESRRALQIATEGMLPNIFAGNDIASDRIRTFLHFTAHEARLAQQLIRPFEDPVWRAESSYPFHVAALARRYRVCTHPAERKDGLLKLAEGTARTLGILALSEMISRHGFTRSLRQQFRTGATFGTWITLIERFMSDVETPQLQELAALLKNGVTRKLLGEVKDFRNDTHHAHGIRASHELDESVAALEPLVVSALSSVNWLSGIPWNWVERCEYLDESSFRTIGFQLHGSHPSWEPFEHLATYPLRPDRIYVENPSAGRPVDLWPLAIVSVCSECRTRELFLINQIRDQRVILRSLEEHSIEIPYLPPED